MLDMFPDGFEEIERADGVEMIAYTDASGEERLWHAFGTVRGAEVSDGWEDSWKAFHRPVRVGRLWIGPPWEVPDAAALPVVIDPGRAFGTGAHPTTRLCLELMNGVARGSVLDVGCGSGVLSIAAAKLGFGPLIAIDAEEAAVDATRANAAANGVAVEARRADALVAALSRTDLAVANIALAVVEAVAPRIDASRLVTSGYLESDEPSLAGWRRVDRRSAEGWAADLFSADA